MRKSTTAALAILAAASSALYMGASFAGGKAGAAGSAGIGAGVTAGAGAGGANASTSGQANANGNFTTERHFGLDRAQDRMSEQGQAHEKATTNTNAKRKGPKAGDTPAGSAEAGAGATSRATSN